MFQRTIDREQMNITIVLGDKIPSIKYGGTQRVMWYLGKELNKRGHKVTFIAGKGTSFLSHVIMHKDLEANHSFTMDWTGMTTVPPTSPFPEKTTIF